MKFGLGKRTLGVGRVAEEWMAEAVMWLVETVMCLQHHFKDRNLVEKIANGIFSAKNYKRHAGGAGFWK